MRTSLYICYAGSSFVPLVVCLLQLCYPLSMIIICLFAQQCCTGHLYQLLTSTLLINGHCTLHYKMPKKTYNVHSQCTCLGPLYVCSQTDHHNSTEYIGPIRPKRLSVVCDSCRVHKIVLLSAVFSKFIRVFSPGVDP